MNDLNEQFAVETVLAVGMHMRSIRTRFIYACIHCVPGNKLLQKQTEQFVGVREVHWVQ